MKSQKVIFWKSQKLLTERRAPQRQPFQNISIAIFNQFQWRVMQPPYYIGFVCGELPAQEARSFCDFWKLPLAISPHFPPFCLKQTFGFLDVLNKDNDSLSVSKYGSCWCSGFLWISLWRSDKFLLTLSVVIKIHHVVSLVWKPLLILKQMTSLSFTQRQN